MESSPFLWAAVAFTAGAAIAWVLASSRSKARQAGAESAAAELRRQLEVTNADLAASRARLSEEQQNRAYAQAALSEAQKNLNEQKAAFEEASAKLKETFDALAARALAESNRQFLHLAEEKFKALQSQATGDLAQKQEAIRGLVDPLHTAVKNLFDQIQQTESSRHKDQGELINQLQQLTQTNEQLRVETGSLVTSLRQPQIKGKWGELLLRRAAELAGMSPHCDFTEQLTTDTEEGRLRPDMVVHLPGGRNIVVDAKVPLHAFLQALSTKTNEDYWTAMKDHARLVREHVKKLESKRYSENLPDTPEFVVLFLPAEAFFSAALEQDHELIEFAMDKGVVLASPTTLLALLKAVAYGWRQQDAWKNAEKITELGKELHDRVVNFIEHLADIRTGLERAVKSYNNAVGSLEARLLPSSRKFKGLGVTSADEIPEIAPVEVAPRQLSVPADEER